MKTAIAGTGYVGFSLAVLLAGCSFRSLSTIKIVTERKYSFGRGIEYVSIRFHEY